ncbi:hypothetical protein [Corynebacterium lubricantis]|uniref:hypothetical protein n=1 Tax=Corynebacterium lubricantis TaxID=541095 RepID=UPI00036CC415|nr:hypothetical protein [Corynebacterium lubricantis]
MRILYFTLAAVFTFAALILTWTGQSSWLSWIALAVAAVFLVLGLMKKASEMEPEKLELTEDQKNTLRQLKREGNESGAIRQVHMWFRYASAEDAQRLVRELDR